MYANTSIPLAVAIVVSQARRFDTLSPEARTAYNILVCLLTEDERYQAIRIYGSLGA